MAAGIIPDDPVTGPCSHDCAHVDCHDNRDIAGSTCRCCGQRIGYGRRFYDDHVKHGAFVHAACIEDPKAAS